MNELTEIDQTFINHLFNEYQNENKNIDRWTEITKTDLQISQIHHVIVEVKIITYYNSIHLQINSNGYFDARFDDKCSHLSLFTKTLLVNPELKLENEEFLNKDDFVKAILILKNILLNIRFNKLLNLFYVENDFMFNLIQNKHTSLNFAFQLSNQCNHIKTVKTYDKCCVCFEYTYTKTSCNHNICLVCASEIYEKNNKNNNDNEEQYKFIDCPLCRQNVIDFYPFV